MSDLKLNIEGDLEVVKRSNSEIENNNYVINAVYDLNSTTNYTKDLIIKAIKTPKGRITLHLLKEDDIVLYDIEYGSDIYRELSEGLTLNFLSRVKSHVIQALTNAKLNNTVAQVKIGAINSNTIQLNVMYTDNTPSSSIQLSI